MFFTTINCLVLMKCKAKLNLNIFRSISTTLKTHCHIQKLLPHKNLKYKNPFFLTESQSIIRKLSTVTGIQENVLALHMKKRPQRKKRVIENEEVSLPGFWNVKALATAEEYNLESLKEGLLKQNLYVPKEIRTTSKLHPDVIQAVAKYEISNEDREIFFFQEGTVILWNITDLECSNILQFLRLYERGSYSSDLVQAEGEIMLYSYTEQGKRSYLKEGDIFISPNANLDKYAFSNAISQSVKLGSWEASLDRYIDSIEFVTEDLKAGRKILMTRQQVLRKQGELFALRHLINLSSDLLDTPDFYWERDDLETLYKQTYNYYNIAKRTRVMNEKINHCVELVELLSSHLSDKHHIRLEWMIIVLIMVEVGFETLHYLDRYFAKEVILY